MQTCLDAVSINLPQYYQDRNNLGEKIFFEGGGGANMDHVAEGHGEGEGKLPPFYKVYGKLIAALGCIFRAR